MIAETKGVDNLEKERVGLKEIPVLFPIIYFYTTSKDLEEETSVSGKERREHQRLNSHKLDEDVERRAGCVLKRVPDGVADHGSFVGVRTFRAEGPSML